MFDENLRRRLEALNRGPLPDVSGMVTARQTAVDTVSPPAETGSPIAALPRPQRPMARPRVAKAIAGLLSCGEVIETSAGEHLRIRLPLDAFWPGGGRLVDARHQHLRQMRAESQQAVEPNVVMQPEFAALVDALPERAILLDLETCGLAGAALFLAGLLRQFNGEPTVELLVARNYGEEQAVLESLWQTVVGHEVLVTFNGKAFDWPMVIDRSARYRLNTVRSSCNLLHLDLLHHARRRWRRQLPDCRLQTLEQTICRRSRTGDIPGHMIPAAYAQYVRTGFEREMDAILYHNAVDLVTLLDLALRLAA